MGFLAEQAQVLQALAVGSRGDHEFDADQQAAAADLLDVGMADFLQLIEQPGAHFGGAVRQALVFDDAQGGAGDGACQGVAAIGAAVAAGTKHA